MNNEAEFRKPLSRSANERISDGHVLRLAYGDANFRARCVSFRYKYTGTTAVVFIAWLPSYSAKERP